MITMVRQRLARTTSDLFFSRRTEDRPSEGFVPPRNHEGRQDQLREFSCRLFFRPFLQPGLLDGFRKDSTPAAGSGGKASSGQSGSSAPSFAVITIFFIFAFSP
jgi:hypothetical protein